MDKARSIRMSGELKGKLIGGWTVGDLIDYGKSALVFKGSKAGLAAVLKVFPSLAGDQVEQLRRTFAGMTAYEVDTRITRQTVANDTATVLARLTRRMTPRVGRAGANEVNAVFQLRRSGTEWVIVSVAAK